MKKWWLLPLVVLISAFLTVSFWKRNDSIVFGNQRLKIEIADSELARANGLSGRDNLAANRGMLFIFPIAEKHCFWMKDMKLNLDILWLDEQQKVIYLKENLSPSTYPESYCPRQDAKYVLEVNGGLSQQAGVDEGDRIEF